MFDNYNRDNSINWILFPLMNNGLKEILPDSLVIVVRTRLEGPLYRNIDIFSDQMADMMKSDEENASWPLKPIT